jgi:hypothetical protein
LGVRVPAPTHEEVVATLHSVAKKEYLKLPDALATRIAEKSGRNLRRAVLMLETAKVPPDKETPSWLIHSTTSIADITCTPPPPHAHHHHHNYIITNSNTHISTLCML